MNKSKKKHSAKKTVLLLCIVLSIICNLYSSTVQASENVSYENIDNMLKYSTKKLHIPGMSIEIVNSEKVMFSGTYGNCDNIDSPFIIGSLSKSFTAVCIMQLVDDNRINLDDPVSKYIDAALYFKNKQDADKITIRQLLNQTSGLGTYQRFKTAEITEAYNKHQYANVNYGILGKVIEAVSGESYEDYVTKNIFNKLDMTHSAASYEKASNNGLIDGYRNYFGISVKGEPDFPTDESWSIVPAGYLSSSASDMGKYLQMYLNQGSNVLSEKSVNAMFYDNVYVDTAAPYYYGMGWIFVEQNNEKILNHSGLVENYMSFMYILPERDIAAIVLVNTNDYLVTNNLINAVYTNILSELVSIDMQNINGFSYYLYHGILNVIYLAVILCGLIPILRIKKWKGIKKSTKTKSILCIISNVAYHVILPSLLLMLSSILGIPLWVLWYFVKDLFIVIVLASAMLYLSGIIKVIYIIKSKK